ncbi:hypothetical protein DLAC_09631 [Tieghemostelium lacteum]|uniref:Uncharacterized protein n=1 Tax=Tieghemostelium lacteum TaxID=361077 RepID=A0A151Z6S9_TIELA|nr:hypothetical protein DLAC_09631 [Tieghemostelium lacteum]|eukprot:KYQ89666.1 hypothetical protein DLAC_09631 [Tieghemostelium lacteum]
MAEDKVLQNSIDASTTLQGNNDIALLEKPKTTVQGNLVKRSANGTVVEDTVNSIRNSKNSKVESPTVEAYYRDAVTGELKSERVSLSKESPFGGQNSTTTLKTINTSESGVILEKDTPIIIGDNSVSGSESTKIGGIEFVTVPFSPPLKSFSIDQNSSSSELPYLKPDNIDKDITRYCGAPSLTSSQSQVGASINSMIGGGTRFGGLEIPLDDESSDVEHTYGRVSASVPNDSLNYSVISSTFQDSSRTNANNNVGGVEPRPVEMVEVNINVDNAAINDGADIPVAVPRRRTSNQDIASMVALACICLIIIGCCVAFFVI